MAADTACAGQDAGSVSAVGGDLAALFALQDRARAMEAEILMIIETLDNMPGKPGAKGKLVDAEGFPRADVDIHAVRIHRNRLAYLQTDHQAAMKEIEQKLFARRVIDPRASSPATVDASHRERSGRLPASEQVLEANEKQQAAQHTRGDEERGGRSCACTVFRE